MARFTDPNLVAADAQRKHDLASLATASTQPVAGSELVLSLLSASPDCVKLLSPEGALDFMSHAGLCTMEIDDFEMVDGQLWWMLWPEKERERLQNAVAHAREGNQDRFVAFCPTAKGTPKWWDVSVAPIRDIHGGVGQILAVSRDVTDLVNRNRELEAAIAEAELLRREVDHRVKNSLGIVSGLLRMQARNTSGEAKDQLKRAAERVQAIAEVHDALHKLPKLPEIPVRSYVTDLCRALVRSHDIDQQGAAHRIDVDDIVMTPDRTVALGLIIAELVGNAYRHSEMGKEGVIEVRLACLDAGKLRLFVRDNGIGLPEAAQSGGMGMQVIDAMASQLGGKIEASNHPEGGAQFILEFEV